MNFGKVGILMGGKSAERDISVKSGCMILKALRRREVDCVPFDPAKRGLYELIQERFDRVFVALHGRFGEDGTMQGILEWLQIPYTGSGVLASALAMDKVRTKRLWQAEGIPTPSYAVLNESSDYDSISSELGSPFIVKPANEGSSLGISKVDRASDLRPAYTVAVKHDPIVIAESFIEGDEYTAAILNDEMLPLIKLETPHRFYDYDGKYISNDTRYLIPCGLPADHERKVGTMCLAAYQSLGCRGWGRVDLMIDRAGRASLLEVNTAPGMTNHSLVPMAARAVGLSYEDLCIRILEGAVTG